MDRLSILRATVALQDANSCPPPPPGMSPTEFDNNNNYINETSGYSENGLLADRRYYSSNNNNNNNNNIIYELDGVGECVNNTDRVNLETTLAKVVFVEPPDEVDSETAETLNVFYAKITEVRQLINDIVAMSAEHQTKHNEKIQIIDESQNQILRASIEQLEQDIACKAKLTKDLLDAMQQETTILKETERCREANSAVIRIRENQYVYLLGQLVEAMNKYEEQQQHNEEEYKAQTMRQIKIKYTNPDGTAIDDVTAQQLTQQVMENNMTSYIFQQSKDVLATIIENRNDIYRIEMSMRNLNQIFNDLAFLVYEQGELMDVILANVQASTRYVEKAHNELKKGRKYEKKSRKKMICIIVIVVIIIVLFVMLGLLGHFIPK